MAASPESTTLKVSGLTCVNCARGLEQELRRLGFATAKVDFTTETVRHRPTSEKSTADLRKAVQALGYQVALESVSTGRPRRLSSLHYKAIFSSILSAPLLAHMFLPHDSLLHDEFVQLALCLPVFLLGFWHFGRSALRSLRSRLLNMDVLIVIGISASFGYSLTGTLLQLGPDYLFYETAAAITTIVLIGNLLEAHSVRKTTSAVEELRKLQGTPATKIVERDGRQHYQEIDSSAAQVGDRFLLQVGSRVPADGTAYWGQGAVDESIISGESLPAEKSTGSQLIGGTILVAGSLRMEARAVGAQTVLAEMLQLVEEAQLSPPRIQRIGDQVSAVFVPVVLLLAIATFLGSLLFLELALPEALLRAVAVLVVACPCAMGLATPTAVMVGLGRAAQAGILIKGGRTLEDFGQTRRIVFDKTGTLSTGRFRLADFKVLKGDPAQLKSICYSLERHSRHPVALSLIAALQAQAQELDCTEVHEEAGLGVRGLSDGQSYVIRTLAGRPEGDLYPHYDIGLFANDEIQALISLQDELKPDAAATVQDLKKLGLEVLMLSGDTAAKAERSAVELGISEFYSGQQPARKLELIKEWESKQTLAFVGDGVNDAPALAAAGVGISLSAATHIAIQAAKVVVLGDSLRKITDAYLIAKATLRTIKQNLFWAFFYNVLAIPAAAAGFLTPMMAAIAMGLSDVMVIGNSLRLRRRKLPIA